MRKRADSPMGKTRRGAEEKTLRISLRRVFIALLHERSFTLPERLPEQLPYR